jgi:hypothetical protein
MKIFDLDLCILRYFCDQNSSGPGVVLCPTQNLLGKLDVVIYVTVEQYNKMAS